MKPAIRVCAGTSLARPACDARGLRERVRERHIHFMSRIDWRENGAAMADLVAVTPAFSAVTTLQVGVHAMNIADALFT